jgi:integrase
MAEASRQQRILTKQEITTLLTACTDKFDRMLIKTCLGHGLRNEETVTLQRRHVNFGNTGVDIERENTKSPAGVRFVPTLDSLGDIPIQEDFIDWVNSHTENPDDYVFASPRTDSHISTKYFQDLMRDLAWENAFYPQLDSKEEITEKVPEPKRVRPHALRHTYGTRMYENGVPPKELSDTMGHKEMQTTMDLYAHLANEKNRDVLNEAAKNWE